MNNLSIKKALDNCIIFSIYLYCITFLFNDTAGYTFIRIAFILGLIKTLKYNNIEFNWIFFKKYLKPIILFLGIIFLSLVVHGFEYASISQYERLLKALIPLITVLFFVSKKQHIYNIIFFLLLSMFINDFYAIYDWLINHNTRTSGIDMGILYFSGMLLLQLPVILSIFFYKNITQNQKTIVIFFLLCTLLTIYTNGSRMTWLICIIDIFIVLSIYIKSWKRKISIFFSLILCLITIYTVNPNVNMRVTSLFDTNNVSTRGHYFYLRDGFNLFWKHKLIGVGLDNFKMAMIENNTVSDEALENLKKDLHSKINGQYVMPHAHNDIVMFLSEIGILGAVIYIYMFGGILVYTLKNWYLSKDIYALAIFLMTINILFRGLSDYNIANLGVISVYFFSFGLYLKYTYLRQNNNKYIINKKYILSIYAIFIFTILLRIASKHLF